jgi:hypothetical protein
MMKYYIRCDQDNYVFYWSMTGDSNKGIRSGYLGQGIANAHKFPKKLRKYT